MSDPHEPCATCGSPGVSWNYRGRWYVHCTSFGCHNTTAGAEFPESAWEVWDTYMRRQRTREAYADRKRAEALAAMGATAPAPAQEEIPF